MLLCHFFESQNIFMRVFKEFAGARSDVDSEHIAHRKLRDSFGSTLPACEVGQKYYALKKSSPFLNSR